RPDEVDARHRLPLALPLVEDRLDVRERLEPRAESRLRPADALRDGADAAAVERVQVEDAVGLAEPERAEHDRLGLVGAAGHARSSLGRGGAGNLWRPLRVEPPDGAHPHVYDALVRLLRPRQGAPRGEGVAVRGDR